MRKTFAAGAATSGTGRPTRVIHANRRVFQLTPQRNNSSRPPRRRQTIDYLDQTIIDYRDHSHGTTGITGTISSANSLVGSNPGDDVGGITVLTNGNYVVASSSWNNGTGAATWGSGTAGVSGTIDSSNSLVGSSAGDVVGSSVKALPNGNYVVGSYAWNGNIGAVTWVNGTNGHTSNNSNTISSANSLVGAQAGDQVGNFVTALTNGNYVVSAYDWNSNTGAVTLVNGSNGHTSNNSNTISAANSLVGAVTGDSVGDWDLIALSNGNYVVVSGSWNNGLGASTWVNGTNGRTVDGVNTISAANSVLGQTADYGMNDVFEDTVNGTYLTSFAYSATPRLFVSPSSGDINSLNFSFLPGADFTVDTAYLAATLGAGTNVTLKANNDITVANNVTVTSPGGNLTLDAGRSILVNANITTDNGDLTLLANDTAAHGVVDAERDAGTAVIAMANGTSIDAGTGSVDIELLTGAGNTNHAAGDLTLQGITAGGILAVNANGNGDVVLDGTLTASGAGNAIVLASGQNFINNAGASALSASNGRWLSYSTDPADDTPDGLTADFTRYGSTYSGYPPASVTETGNGFLYSSGTAPGGGGNNNAIDLPDSVVWDMTDGPTGNWTPDEPDSSPGVPNGRLHLAIHPDLQRAFGLPPEI